MRKLLVVVAVLTAVVTQNLQAQGLPLAVEARGGFSPPTGDWNEDEELNTGTGFSIGAILDVAPMVGIYAGWERFTFGIDDSDLEGAEAESVDTGLRAGVELSLPLAAAPVAPFVFGGILYHQLSASVSDESASIDFKSDRTIGFEVGGGIVIPLGTVVSFTPAVRYSSHSAEFDAFSELGGSEMTVGRVTVDLGLRFGF